MLLGLAAGNIAFEAAQRLVRLGEQVPLVVLIDAWAPSYFAGLTRREAQLGELRKFARGRLSPLDFLCQRVPQPGSTVGTVPGSDIRMGQADVGRDRRSRHPGDHLGIFDEAGAGIMAGHLNQALEGTSFQGGTLSRESA